MHVILKHLSKVVRTIFFPEFKHTSVFYELKFVVLYDKSLDCSKLYRAFSGENGYLVHKDVRTLEPNYFVPWRQLRKG